MSLITAVSTARFVIYRAPDGYRWHLKAGNGEIIAHGDAYVTRDNARRAVETVKRLAPSATIEDV